MDTIRYVWVWYPWKHVNASGELCCSEIARRRGCRGSYRGLIKPVQRCVHARVCTYLRWGGQFSLFPWEWPKLKTVTVAACLVSPYWQRNISELPVVVYVCLSRYVLLIVPLTA